MYVCNQTGRYIFYSWNTDDIIYTIKTLSLCMYVCIYVCMYVCMNKTLLSLYQEDFQLSYCNLLCNLSDAYSATGQKQRSADFIAAALKSIEGNTCMYVCMQIFSIIYHFFCRCMYDLKNYCNRYKYLLQRFWLSFR